MLWLGRRREAAAVAPAAASAQRCRLREEQQGCEPHFYDAYEVSVGRMRWVWLTDFGPATALRIDTSEVSAGIGCVVLLP